MIQLIHKFLLWLLLVICHEEPIMIPTKIFDSNLIHFAKELCIRQDHLSAPGTSGEYKRDRVYEQMLNTFPEIRPKHLYLAILLARIL